jgi:hypothetical protein
MTGLGAEQRFYTSFKSGPWAQHHESFNSTVLEQQHINYTNAASGPCLVYNAINGHQLRTPSSMYRCICGVLPATAAQFVFVVEPGMARRC